MTAQRLFHVRVGAASKGSGGTRHVKGSSVLQRPTSLEIVRDDSGYFLYYLDEANRPQTDTWHDSLDAAFEQARFEFGISPADWIADGEA